MSRRLALLIVTTLGAFAAAAVTASYSANVAGDPAAGVVVTDVGGRIVAVNADGSGVRALTRPNPLRYENDEAPVPSPDGALIVFARWGDPERVMLMRADGSRLRTLARAELDSAQWSPDGSRLALETSPSFQLPKGSGPTLITFKQGISLVARDGSGSRSLVGAAAHGRLGFSWSPDGTRIAYTGHDDISVVDVATGERRVLVAMEDAWRPAWSPDGSRIAFLTDDDLYVVDATGGKARRLGTNVESETPAWSPDGSRLAFTVQAYPRPSAVVVVAAATGRVTARIGPLAGGGSAAPAWSPDGSRLSFLRARVPGDFAAVDGDVWVAAADGSRPRQVTRSFPFGGSHSTAHWLAGVDAVTPDPQPPALLLRPLASHRLPAQYGIAAVDGKAAAIVKESEESGGGLGIWRAGGPVTWVKGAHADRVALAGNRIYWSWYGSDREGSATELWTATRGGRPVRLASHEGDDPDGPALMVAGDRSLVVYTSEGTLWRLEGARATPIRHERAGFLEPLSVDNGRVLLWNGHKLEVVNRHGKLLATVPPGKDPVAALLRGQRVILLGHSQVVVRRIPAGSRVATWPVGAPGRAERVGLAHGSLFPYGTENGYGAANYRLLGLTSGRDRILALPQGMSPTDVAVDGAGLFYTAIPPYRGVHGEVGFVPSARLAAAVAGM